MKKHLHRLMYGLLYPAILGTVFVVFLSDDLFQLRIYPRTFLGVIFLLHWSFEFILATAKKGESEYTPWKFVTEILLIGVIYLVFTSLSLPAGAATIDYSKFYLFVAFIPGIFLIQDLGILISNRPAFTSRMLVWDLVLLVGSLGCWHYAGRLQLLQTDLAVYVFLVFGATISVASFWIRRRDLRDD